MCGDSLMVKQLSFQITDGGSIPTSPLQLYIKRINYETASLFYRKWHYLGSSGFIQQFNFGAYYDEVIVGSISFGAPLAKNISGLYTSDNQEGILELTRLAMVDYCPKNSESRFIAIAIKILRRIYPLRILITYADPSVGHTGVIYRASGFEYKGLTAQKTDYFVNGKRYKGSSVWNQIKNMSGEWKPRQRKHLFIKIFYK